MRQDTAIIIPFPATPPEQVPSTPVTTSRSKRLEKLLDATSQNTTSRSQAIPRAIAMCTTTPAAFPDSAIVAQVVIGFARRKGIAMESIPKVFREQLLTLCAAGDPTALMLRDWLGGNRKLLAIDGMPTPHDIHGTVEGA